MSAPFQCDLQKLKDAALVVSAFVIAGLVDLVPGKQQYLTDAALAEVKYPYLSNTVPSWSLSIISIVIPICSIVLAGRLLGVDLREQYSALVGVLLSVSSTTLFTDIVKLTVGRPRPSFYYRCFPDGVEDWAVQPNHMRTPICHPLRERDVVDGYKSFPSGHTSLSMAGLAYLSLFLYHHSTASSARRGEQLPLGVLFLCILPTLFATWIGCTRISDFAHNYTDVCSGAILGASVAYILFRQQLPQGPGTPEDVSATPLLGRSQFENTASPEVPAVTSVV